MEKFKLKYEIGQTDDKGKIIAEVIKRKNCSDEVYDAIILNPKDKATPYVLARNVELDEGEFIWATGTYSTHIMSLLPNLLRCSELDVNVEPDLILPYFATMYSYVIDSKGKMDFIDTCLEKVGFSEAYEDRIDSQNEAKEAIGHMIDVYDDIEESNFSVPSDMETEFEHIFNELDRLYEGEELTNTDERFEELLQYMQKNLEVLKAADEEVVR